MTLEAKRTVPIAQPKFLVTGRQKTVALPSGSGVVLYLVERAAVHAENSPSVAVRIIFPGYPDRYHLQLLSTLNIPYNFNSNNAQDTFVFGESLSNPKKCLGFVRPKCNNFAHFIYQAGKLRLCR